MPSQDPSQLALLLAEIEGEFRLTAVETGEQVLDARVREALARVPRERFVPEFERSSALDNRALPIGYGQTISQPFIVALMTQLLRPMPDMRVLEVGTGSGYQAAVLAQLVRQVYSIEVVPELAEAARRRLAELGIANVEVRCADGRDGLPDEAPFDAVIATAAPREVPPALIAQLKPGGRMVVPAGERSWGQQLLLVQKDAEGGVSRRDVLPVAFVPMV